MEPQRRFRGRFDAQLTDEQLLDAVAVVARHARAGRPSDVSMRAFNAGRASAGWPNCPTAEAIYQRFNPPGSQRIAWAALVRLALLPAAERAGGVKRLRRSEATRELGDENIIYGLLLVARYLRRDWVTLAEYDPARARLVADDRRRNGEEAMLAEVVPTLAQIEHRTGSQWTTALALAGLRSRAEAQRDGGQDEDSDEDREWRPRGLTIAQGMAYFAAVNGRWPGYRTLRQFTRACGAALSELTDALDRHRDEAARLLNAAGLPAPLTTPRRGGGARLASYYPIDGLPGARRRNDDAAYRRERIVAGLQIWLRTRPTAGLHDVHDYLYWSQGSGWPAPSSFAPFGGFAALRSQAAARNQRGEDPDPDKLRTPTVVPLDEEELIASLREAAAAPRRPLDEQRSNNVMSLAMMLDAGLLNAGERMRMRRDGGEFYAALTAGGGMLIEGHGLAPTPSTAARMILGRSENGWQAWYVQRDGRWVRLNTLVGALRAQLGRRKPPRLIGIKPLLDAGLLRPGEPLLVRIDGGERHATILADGRIEVPGCGAYGTPSRAMRALGQNANGWKRWRAQRDGDWVLLQQIARPLLAGDDEPPPKLTARDVGPRPNSQGGGGARGRRQPEILAAVAELGEPTTAEVAQRVDISYNNALRYLRDMARRGQVVNIKPAVGERTQSWRLTAD